MPSPPLRIIHLAYDANDNLVNDTRLYYEYGANNMLKRLRNAVTGAVVEEYWYNPAGDRVKKVAYVVDGRNRTTYYVNAGYEVEVNETGGRKITKYVFANGERLVEIKEDGSKVFYLDDHLGSSSVLVNQSGQVVDRTTYYPFGEVKTGGTASKYGYYSKEQDGIGLNSQGLLLSFNSDIMLMLVKVETYYDGKFWCARGIGEDIFTQGKTLDEVSKNIREAVALHFEEQLRHDKTINILILSETEVKSVSRNAAG